MAPPDDDSIHICIHEAELAVMTDNLKVIKDDIKSIKDGLFGENGDGLKTRMALADQSIRRIWWWVGGTSLILAGAIVKLMVSLGHAIDSLPK